jgi:hypothetical protein
MVSRVFAMRVTDEESFISVQQRSPAGWSDDVLRGFGQTPLYEQLGQLVVQSPANLSGRAWQDLLGAGLASIAQQQVGQQVANLLANLFV